MCDNFFTQLLRRRVARVQFYTFGIINIHDYKKIVDKYARRMYNNTKSKMTSAMGKGYGRDGKR